MEMMAIHDGGSRAMAGHGDDRSFGWALGLRQLYQVVAEQPVPLDLNDLLARVERHSVHHHSQGKL